MPRHYRTKKMPIGPVQPRRSRKKTVAATAKSALSLAKKNAQQQEIRHFIQSNTIAGINNATTWAIDGVDMTAATPTGYISKAKYSGGKTGIAGVSIMQLDRQTSDADEGYRTGNAMTARSVWIRGKLTCSVNSNVNVRVMLLKTKGLFNPDALKSSIYKAGTTPALYGFVDHGKASKIQKVLYDRTFKLIKYDDSQKDQQKFFSIFRKLNTKLFYGEDTLGSGTGETRRDQVIGTTQYMLVFLTDEVTNTVGIETQSLFNYHP